MYRITDEVLHQIELHILEYPPERGGALLGPEGSTVITSFLLDEEALTTPASYLPSPQLTNRVRAHEAESGLQLQGVIHSHPGAMDHPSPMDLEAIASALESNPHLNSFACPIVTAGRALKNRPLEAHETPLEGGKISWFVGRRRRAGAVTLPQSSCTVLPISRDCQAVADYLSAEVGNAGLVEFDGRQFLARRFDLIDGVDLTLMFGFDYPVSPPVAILGLGTDETRYLNLRWPLDLDEGRRVRAALGEHFAPIREESRPYRLAWRPRDGEALTEDESTGLALGWIPVCTNADVARRARDVRDAALARTAGLLPDHVKERHVMVAGAGSVGSYIAEQLVRSGVGRITLVDPEVVELPNISRASYRLEDVGQKKVKALARQLLSINPLAEVRCLDSTVQGLGIERLIQSIEEADLLVSTIDDRTGPRLLNRVAYALGKPGVFVGIYAAARGGEVVITIPERTACYRCATNFRIAAEQANGAVTARTDYGTGRLVGEVALGCDVHHVSTAAVKIALSLLMPHDSEGELRDFADPVVQHNASYILFGMAPDYFIFPAIFSQVPGQHAFQSVWAEVEQDVRCTVCGEQNARLDPGQVSIDGPSVETLRDALPTTEIDDS